MTEFIPILGGMVKYTQKEESGRYKLTAVAVDPATHRTNGRTPNRIIAQSEAELPIKKDQVISRARKILYDEQKRPRFRSPAKKRDPTEASPIRDAFCDLRRDDPRLKQFWFKDSTIKSGFGAFQYKILPCLEAQDGNLTRADVVELYEQLKAKAGQTKWSKTNVSSHETNAAWALRSAFVIYNILREDHPEFPYIDFSPVRRGKRILLEQAKVLPETVRQNLVKYLEDHLETEPWYVRATVLMFDAAARTAEAAAIYAACVQVFGDFAVLFIRSQLIDGEIRPYSKSRAGYRDVTLSFWGKTMVCRCNQLIGDYDAPKPEIKRTAELSAWIKKALKECGLEKAFEEAAERLLIEEPDFNDDGTRCYDIHAYILRRDRSVRWLNICGISPADVDYYLGHANDLSTAEVSNFKTPEYHRHNALLLENYVYDPAITRQSFLCPALVSKESPELSFQPTVANAFLVRGEGLVDLLLSGITSEVGTSTVIIVPKGIIPHIITFTSPRGAIATGRPVIGRQALPYCMAKLKEKKAHEG